MPLASKSDRQPRCDAASARRSRNSRWRFVSYRKITILQRYPKATEVIRHPLECNDGARHGTTSFKNEAPFPLRRGPGTYMTVNVSYFCTAVAILSHDEAVGSVRVWRWLWVRPGSPVAANWALRRSEYLDPNCNHLEQSMLLGRR